MALVLYRLYFITYSWFNSKCTRILRKKRVLYPHVPNLFFKLCFPFSVKLRNGSSPFVSASKFALCLHSNRAPEHEISERFYTGLLDCFLQLLFLSSRRKCFHVMNCGQSLAHSEQPQQSYWCSWAPKMHRKGTRSWGFVVWNCRSIGAVIPCSGRNE